MFVYIRFKEGYDMLFTSLEFLLFFLPIVLIVNILLPSKVRNIWLFIASLFFYAWGEPHFVLIMAISILLNYILALAIDRFRKHSSIRKLILIIDLSLNIGILFVYKYLNFTTSILHEFNPSITVTDYLLPIGISFYSFQAISYVVDVYRGEKAQTNLINVGLYIAFFPQLIAGPIVRYSDIKWQFSDRKITFDYFSDGIRRFLIGFNKKMLIANMVAIVADHAFDCDERTVFMAWLGALCYTLQIYFDFSGYSDMAVGLGKLMGFTLPKNFDYPYSSKTITEFWRRWHISLGQWFRDYLYFPLGGSKVSSKSRQIFNLMVVWTVTGIWHGANKTFILWGIMYGILISIEKLLSIPSKVTASSIFGRIYQFFTLVAVMLGWVLFRSDRLRYAYWYFEDMIGLRNGQIITANDVFFAREYCFSIICGIIFSLPMAKVLLSKCQKNQPTVYCMLDSAIYLANILLFAVGVSYLVISSHNPFIYFNF